MTSAGKMRVQSVVPAMPPLITVRRGPISSLVLPEIEIGKTRFLLNIKQTILYHEIEILKTKIKTDLVFGFP
jgi:hypothetical protein